MKTKILLLLFLFPIIKMSSQSITLTFNGMPLGSEHILIENITNGTSVILDGENTITLSTSSINSIKSNGQSAYPNPFKNEMYLEFESNSKEEVEIIVVNQIGQLILHEVKKVAVGFNKLKFEASKKGMYFIQIKGRQIKKSYSVICEETNNSVANLTFIETKELTYSQNKSINNITFSFGDILKYTATNDNKISIITDTPTITKSYTFEFYDCIDYEQNIYPIVKVGTQWWMAENLKSTKYSNGSNISGSYTYDNNSANEDVYGRLYTWAAMMNGATGNNNNPSGVHGVCPTGWHVPSELEWDELRDALGGKIPMHGKIKEAGTSHWFAPNSDATNESGMTVLPGGLRWGDDGTFQDLGEQAYFWNATDDLSGTDILNASGYTFFNETSDYYMYTWNPKTMAQSVRCVKD